MGEARNARRDGPARCHDRSHCHRTRRARACRQGCRSAPRGSIGVARRAGAAPATRRPGRASEGFCWETARIQRVDVTKRSQNITEAEAVCISIARPAPRDKRTAMTESTNVAETAGASSTAPSKSLPARIVGVLFAPRATYADVAARPHALGVLLFVILFGACGVYAFLSTEVGRNAMLEQQVESM